MNNIRCIILLVFVLCCPAIFADGVYTVESVPNDHIQLASDYVSNPDQIISAQAEQDINSLISSVEGLASAEIAVVLLNSIGSDNIDNFGTRLFTHWGIGKDKKDNGLLFLLVLDQREMIFRTGYGLEGVLPDVILSRVIRNDISPKLKQGDFDAGIIAGVGRVCNYLKDPEAVKEIIQKEASAQTRKSYTVLYFYLAISVLVFLLFLFTLISKLGSDRTNYKKYLDISAWKIGTVACMILFPALMVLFAIAFFMILKRLRNKPLSCLDCGDRMHKLSESKEDEYLSPSQQREEAIQSIDYDVWLCDSCQKREILPYTKMSRYKICPNCHAKTFYMSDDHTVKRATTLSSGLGEQIYACKNCEKKDRIQYTIPIVVLPSGGSSRGGGFSGGGGSWGGGSTGGGGARGGW